MGIVFGVGMPFAEIANGALTSPPSRQSNGFVAERLPLNQAAKLLVPFVGAVA